MITEGNSSMGIPDYSNPIHIPVSQTTFIAPSDGYIYVCSDWDRAEASIKVNGNYVDFSKVGDMGYGGELASATGFVAKGSICTLIGNARKTFYPLKK